ncbi:MAG: hypothetical protein V8Q57_09200 [Blautia sp.]
MALDKLLKVRTLYCEENIRHILGEMENPVRELAGLNTANGLGDLINKRSIAREVCSAVDVVSVLNMPDAKSYNEVVRSCLWRESF